MPGTLIKKLREEKGYSQKGVAHALNMSQVAYCKIENNQTELKVWHCKILSQVFGVDIYNLLPSDFEIHRPALKKNKTV
jgi:transcriptional regulator with XRE-family HTH domain